MMRKVKPAASGSRTKNPNVSEDPQPCLPGAKAERRKNIATPKFEVPPQRFNLAADIVAPDPGPGLFDTLPEK
jgi:hypothetical protein